MFWARVVKECKDYKGYIVVKLYDNNCVFFWYKGFPNCFDTREEAEKKFKELCEMVQRPDYEDEVLWWSEWI